MQNKLCVVLILKTKYNFDEHFGFIDITEDLMQVGLHFMENQSV